MATEQHAVLQMNKGMYIAGEWVHAAQDPLIVRNPATGQIVGQVPRASAEQVQRAIDAASHAFAGWSALTAAERSKVLHRIADTIESRIDELALLVTREQGKPLGEARGEVQYGADFWRWYAEEARRIYGEVVPAPRGKRIEVFYQPTGVTAAITPWNFPSSMISRKLAPALAAGNTVVLKPAEQTPLSAVALVEIFAEVGLPPGVVNLVTGDPVLIGGVLMDDERVRHVTFTGSTEVGLLLARQAVAQLKRISLELGGHAPFIVFEDADLDRAVDGLLASKLRNMGQACISANRLLVQENIAAAFYDRVVCALEALTLGNGEQAGVQVGPVINADSFAKISEQVDEARAAGAVVMAGGCRWTGSSEGYFYMPTLVTGVGTGTRLFREETFGPVLASTTFADEAEAIALANDCRYGLASYLYTRDISRAARVASALEFGVVGVNDSLPMAAQAPFGGWKLSGVGREGGHWGIEEFLETKYVSTGLE